MISIPKVKLLNAHARLEHLGFTKQHDRIFQFVYKDGDVEYRCMLGFEDTDDADHYEINLSVMSRKVQAGAKSIRADDIKVLSVDATPEQVQEVLNQAEESLENL